MTAAKTSGCNNTDCLEAGGASKCCFATKQDGNFLHHSQYSPDMRANDLDTTFAAFKHWQQQVVYLQHDQTISCRHRKPRIILRSVTCCCPADQDLQKSKQQAAFLHTICHQSIFTATTKALRLERRSMQCINTIKFLQTLTAACPWAHHCKIIDTCQTVSHYVPIEQKAQPQSSHQFAIPVSIHMMQGMTIAKGNGNSAQAACDKNMGMLASCLPASWASCKADGFCLTKTVSIYRMHALST